MEELVCELLIVGGSFAGIECAQRLGTLKDTILIDRKDYFEV